MIRAPRPSLTGAAHIAHRAGAGALRGGRPHRAQQHRFTRRDGYGRAELVRMSPVLLDEADRGDKLARQIVTRAGRPGRSSPGPGVGRTDRGRRGRGCRGDGRRPVPAPDHRPGARRDERTARRRARVHGPASRDRRGDGGPRPCPARHPTPVPSTARWRPSEAERTRRSSRRVSQSVERGRGPSGPSAQRRGAGDTTLRCEAVAPIRLAVWVPRRSHLVVSSENQRSTRFIQELYVGVKWSLKRGCATSQRAMAGVLWVETLSSTMCTSRWVGPLCG